MKVRILLVDDHALFRAGIGGLLNAEPGFEVVGEAENGRQAVLRVKELSPDVVLMDVTMPELNGIEATRLVLAEHPRVRVLMVSMHHDRRYVIESLRAGAVGYLPKDGTPEELTAAIRAVASNQVYLSPRIASVVVEEYVRQRPGVEPSAFEVLTSRERQVLQLIAEGCSTKEIAALLHVSPKTVETHRRQLMSKLEIDSVAGLTKYAVRAGLSPLE